MIFGVKKGFFDQKFKLIFDSLKNEKFTGIFHLIEEKTNLIHNCYAGDFTYEYRAKLISFRETLIGKGIEHPSGVRETLNRGLFRKRAEIDPNIFMPPSAFHCVRSTGYTKFVRGYEYGECLLL